MSLTHLQHTYVFMNLIFPIIYTISLFSLRILRQVTNSVVITYIFGTLFSMIWEIPMYIAGNNYITYSFDNTLGISVLFLNCIWDSIIFMTGILLFHCINRGNFNGIVQLAGITCTCIIQQFLVQFITNGNYSYYTKNKYNPVIFTLNHIDYTCVPYLLWCFMPILYLSGVFEIIERFGPMRKVRTIKHVDLNTDLCSNDLESSCQEIAAVI